MKEREINNLYFSTVESFAKHDPSAKALLFNEALRSVVHTSLLGNFSIPEHYQHKVDKSPSYEGCISLGMDYAYRAGMHDRIKDMDFFVEKFDKAQDIENAHKYIGLASNLTFGKYGAGIAKEAAETFKEGLDTLIKVYGSVDLPEGYSPYNFESFSTKRIINIANRINHLSGTGADTKKIVEEVNSSAPALSYLLIKNAQSSGGLFSIPDGSAGSAINYFSRVLDGNGIRYSIKVDGLGVVSMNGMERLKKSEPKTLLKDRQVIKDWTDAQIQLHEILNDPRNLSGSDQQFKELLKKI